MISLKRVGKYLLPALLIAVLLVSVGVYESFSIGSQPKPNPSVYVGIAFGGNTTAEAKALINKVKGYTNLFILDAGRNALTQNESAVNEICSYAVANGLSVIVNVGVRQTGDASRYWFWNNSQSVTGQWREMWGDKFLGMYYNDEPGGIQLDGNWSDWFLIYPRITQALSNNSTRGNFTSSADYQRFVNSMEDLNQIYDKMVTYMNGTSPPNYNLEANFFVNDVIKGDDGFSTLKTNGVTTFTSDYGLYWWDYKGGYNVMFAELGWNCSVAEQIDLVKGAARMQDKQWGAMITWTYNQTPYLDSYDQIYNQMLTSYEAGAKYIAVFDYPYNGSAYGILTDNQFFTLQKFWNDIHQQNFPNFSQPDAALVLPQNYGWGMRSPNDTIWGFWPPDNKTFQIAKTTGTLLSQYGVSLDIVYADPQYPIADVGYRHVYYWNQTDI
jgi:hypothetical protein